MHAVMWLVPETGFKVRAEVSGCPGTGLLGPLDAAFVRGDCKLPSIVSMHRYVQALS